MSDKDRKNGAKSPERRLLEAMVTLNAINHGRPVPDMSSISESWVVQLEPEMDRQEMTAIIKEAITSRRKPTATSH